MGENVSLFPIGSQAFSLSSSDINKVKWLISTCIFEKYLEERYPYLIKCEIPHSHPVNYGVAITGRDHITQISRNYLHPSRYVVAFAFSRKADYEGADEFFARLSETLSIDAIDKLRLEEFSEKIKNDSNKVLRSKVRVLQKNGERIFVIYEWSLDGRERYKKQRWITEKLPEDSVMWRESKLDGGWHLKEEVQKWYNELPDTLFVDQDKEEIASCYDYTQIFKQPSATLFPEIPPNPQKLKTCLRNLRNYQKMLETYKTCKSYLLDYNVFLYDEIHLYEFKSGKNPSSFTRHQKTSIEWIKKSGLNAKIFVLNSHFPTPKKFLIKEYEVS